MHRTSIPVGLAALVLLAGCIAPLRSGSAGDSSDARTVSVSGTGEVTADADLAVIAVSVVATADAADAARRQVATDVQTVRRALRDAGIPDADVTTASYRISPEYRHDERGSQPTVTGYTAVHTFEVEAAPADAGRVVDTAVESGADRVDGVQFTLTDETRADLRADAIDRAVSAGRGDAEAVAAAADLPLGDLRSVSTAPDYRPYADVRYESAAGGADATTAFEPGPVTVTADVQVVYDVA